MKIFTMFKIIAISACIWVILFLSGKAVDASIGINWARLTSTSFVPSVLVDLLLQNNVTDVRLYNFNEDVISAFAGTGIRVVMVIPEAQRVNESSAKDWVRRKMIPFMTVNFTHVVVGTNGFHEARWQQKPFSTVVTAVKLVQNTLHEFGFTNTKAMLSNSYTGVLDPNMTKPSEAAFNPDVKDYILECLTLFNHTKAPFAIDFFPILYVDLLRLPVEFAFFDNKSALTIPDNGLLYTNLFDYIYDSFVWALKKVGFDDMKVVVGQIGWPTDGWAYANVAYAERFFKGLLPHVMSNQGTPMRPGEPIDVFIHTLADEVRNPSIVPFMRHFGIYRANGEPKYKIDLTGLGRDMYPVTARGISYMPPRWCIYNNGTSDKAKLDRLFHFACQTADCTCLSPGGSCGMLTHHENISFAFNAYYQTNFQNDNSCIFEGLGTVVLENPSRDGCVFLVEVVQGNQQPTEVW